MYQVTINAAMPCRYSQTGFANMATLVAYNFKDRLTAEAVVEAANEDPNIINLTFHLTQLFPLALVTVGVRPLVTNIVPQH